MQLALAGLALGLLAGGAWFYAVERAIVRRQAEREFAAIAHTKAAQIITWRHERLDDGALITDGSFLAEPVVRYLAAPEHVQTEQLRNRFRSLATHGHYVDVLLVSPDGRARFSLTGSAEVSADYVAALSDALRGRRPVLTDLHIDARYAIPHISVVAPIFEGDGPAAPPLGAVVLVCDAAQYLYPLLEVWPVLSRTAETVLVRRDGQSVLFLNPLRRQSGAALTQRLPLSRTDVPAVMGVLGYRGLVEGRDYGGVETVAIVEPVPGSTWVVVAKEDASEVFAGWSLRATELFSMMLLALGGIVAVGLVAWQRDRKAHYRALYLAEERRREADLRFRAIYDRVSIGIAEISLEHRFRCANPTYCRWLGYSEQELIGKHLRDITHPKDQETNLHLQDRLASGAIDHYEMEKRLVCKDGHVFDGLISASLVRDATGQPAYVLGALVDITERNRADEERDRLQAQLMQASKMESVGRLAGGIAHDFNNMLLVILGRTEVVLDQVDPATPLHEDLLEIQKAALRSADLTRQLLAFARKQIVAPQVLDLDATVEGTLKMLRRLIGEDIDLLWRPRAGQWRVKIDPAQLDQVMANLCVNARDSIDGVGRVTIETDTVMLDDAYCSMHAGFVPGEFVVLAVSDDGRGMDKEIQRRIFEPFFTTKALGQGTGLGLSTVYGIVKQNDGFINVYSEPGHGSTFRIYLPRCGSETADSGRVSAAYTPEGRGETVLLVEDEVPILTVAAAMLRRLGYTVLAANTASEAIRLCETHDGKIHLLLTDVVMGDMNGRDLAARLSSIRPDLRRLFMSGYTATVIAHRGVLEEGVDFIQKPFSMHDLAAKVGAALDRS
jgi:PAS domain S-box-containing protein